MLNLYLTMVRFDLPVQYLWTMPTNGLVFVTWIYLHCVKYFLCVSAGNTQKCKTLHAFTFAVASPLHQCIVHRHYTKSTCSAQYFHPNSAEPEVSVLIMPFCTVRFHIWHHVRLQVRYDAIKSRWRMLHLSSSPRSLGQKTPLLCPACSLHTCHRTCM